MGRVACETLVTTGLALVAGEITTKCVIPYASIVRKTVESIGYTDANFGFDFKTCAVMSSVDTQSPDIAMGVDTGGAGDQGLMFGYATNESPELMPLPILLAHKLTKKLADARRAGVPNFLRPDGKSQVSVEYDGDKPVRFAKFFFPPNPPLKPPMHRSAKKSSNTLSSRLCQRLCSTPRRNTTSTRLAGLS